MSEMLIGTGVPDSGIFAQAVANVSAPFNIDPQSGAYPLVGNIIAERRLANQWLIVNLTSRVFVDGLGVSSFGSESENTGMLRIPIMYLPARMKRTLGITPYRGQPAGGTTGNNSSFNKNLAHGVQTNGLDIKFIQVYDEAAQLSKIDMRVIGSSLDLLGRYTSYIPMTCGLLQDADIMATHIGAGLAYAHDKANRNVIAYNTSTTDRGYLQKLMNSLKGKLSNVRGEYKEGVIQYSKDKSVFVMRQEFWDELMTIDNGAIVNSDIGQKMIVNGILNDGGEGTLVGNYVEGKYGGIFIKVVPDEYWDTACAELGLNTTQYAEIQKIMCYIANAEGTYFGMSANTTEIDKAPTTSMGYIIRNDWGWGVKNVRPSSIAFIVKSATSLADFSNPITTFEDITSPADIEAMIEAYQDGSVSEYSLQRIGFVNEDTVCKSTLTVQNSAGASLATASVAVRRGNGGYATVTNKGDGTYTFNLERGETATILISATGHRNATVSVVATDTAGLTYTKTQRLTAS